MDAKIVLDYIDGEQTVFWRDVSGCSATHLNVTSFGIFQHRDLAYVMLWHYSQHTSFRSSDLGLATRRFVQYCYESKKSHCSSSELLRNVSTTCWAWSVYIVRLAISFFLFSHIDYEYQQFSIIHYTRVWHKQKYILAI